MVGCDLTSLWEQNLIGTARGVQFGGKVTIACNSLESLKSIGVQCPEWKLLLCLGVVMVTLMYGAASAIVVRHFLRAHKLGSQPCGLLLRPPPHPRPARVHRSTQAEPRACTGAGT